MNTTDTLSFNANKKCIITMGPKQVSVGSVCMLPYSTLTRIISVKDIIICLNAGAKIREYISDKETIALTPHNFAKIFNEAHEKYLAKFNTNVKSPVEKRETYLIDKADDPIPPAPVEEPAKDLTPQQEEEKADVEAVKVAHEESLQKAAELGIEIPSEVTEGGADLNETTESVEATLVEAEETEDSEEELEEADEEEETSEDQPKESKRNRKRNRH